MVIDVTVADGRQVLVEADSASTASEICSTIASMLQIKDGFGFALFINVAGKVCNVRLNYFNLNLMVWGYQKCYL